jgi:hypothetical protein
MNKNRKDAASNSTRQTSTSGNLDTSGRQSANSDAGRAQERNVTGAGETNRSAKSTNKDV